MKKLLIFFATVMATTGCSLLPRDHDPVMFDRLVVLDIEVDSVDCETPNWNIAERNSEILAKSAAWRSDPQAENLNGLYKHVARMQQGGSVTFCELGKKTAAGRISAAKTALENR